MTIFNILMMTAQRTLTAST
jgi:aquaporin related protein